MRRYAAARIALPGFSFQSSPTPKGGCDVVDRLLEAHSMVFQSSPTPKGGCDLAAPATERSHGTVFQSSPTPKGGCDPPVRIAITRALRFQSSPTPKGGCDFFLSLRARRQRHVSILTHPEGRVRRHSAAALGYFFKVSILTHPEGRVRRRVGQIHAQDQTVSILTHPEGRVRLSGLDGLEVGRWPVSILTHPEGRVRQGVADPVVVLLAFQSSPTPKGGCDPAPSARSIAASRFNPHPPRRAGATPAG